MAVDGVYSSGQTLSNRLMRPNKTVSQEAQGRSRILSRHSTVAALSQRRLLFRAKNGSRCHQDRASGGPEHSPSIA